MAVPKVCNQPVSRTVLSPVMYDIGCKASWAGSSSAVETRDQVVTQPGRPGMLALT